MLKWMNEEDIPWLDVSMATMNVSFKIDWISHVNSRLVTTTKMLSKRKDAAMSDKIWQVTFGHKA